MHVAPDAASSAGPTPNVVYSVSVLFLSAYLSYLVAEVAGFSGIMSLFFTGVCHAHYCFYNVSEESRATTTNAFNTMAFLCETFVFTYLGLQVAQSLDTTSPRTGIGVDREARAEEIVVVARGIE